MVLVLGDIHGNWNHLVSALNIFKPDIVLQCGDFGYWPRDYWADLKKIVNRHSSMFSTPIYFCPGNHENWFELGKLKLDEDGKARVLANIYYMSRGSRLVLPNGKHICFIGGAYSIDRASRILGVSYFEEEIISYSLSLRLQEEIEERFKDHKPDTIISHTCPYAIDIKGHLKERYSDPTRCFLDWVLDRFSPSSWYFGHWHQARDGIINHTYWRALDESAGHFNRWAAELE